MSHIFGPVPSRRLGHSLGVDIVPLKTCTYDCVYCQLGPTTDKTLCRKSYVTVEPVLRELEEVLASGSHIDYVTFSGSGEPTLNVHIGEMITQVKRLTSVPVAVLTNGSLLQADDVRGELLAADLVLPSLDAATEAHFRRVNRPHPELAFGEVVQGLIRFGEEFSGEIWLEIMLVRGVSDDDPHLEELGRLVEQVDPHRVQINTVVRPPAEADALPASAERLEALRVRLGDRAEVIAPFHQEALTAEQQEAGERILDMIQRRPVTLEDITSALGLHPNEALKYVAALKQEGAIRESVFRDLCYYEAVAK